MIESDDDISIPIKLFWSGWSLSDIRLDDKFDCSIEFIKQRSRIIDNAERLFKIDKLIKEINKNVC